MAGAGRLIPTAVSGSARSDLAAPGSLPGFLSGDALQGIGAIARDVSELKRMRDQSTPDSVAERLFRRAWAALGDGVPAASVCLAITADALAATRLAGIDRRMLAAFDVGPDDAATILDRALDEAGAALMSGTVDRLRRTEPVGPTSDRSEPRREPWFVGALIGQPRAGATSPGKPRLALEPPESHGDHCLGVAVLGTLIALQSGADPGRTFLAGLAHHLHNAALPDTGFAGEMLLGDALLPLMRRLTARELDTLAPPLRRTVADALAPIVDADTPEGRAFNAADVIDRVLQAHHHARAAAFTVDQALGDLQLVHEGPLQHFHMEVLSAVRLA